jgi:hypothetical protein
MKRDASCILHRLAEGENFKETDSERRKRAAESCLKSWRYYRITQAALCMEKAPESLAFLKQRQGELGMGSDSHEPDSKCFT